MAQKGAARKPPSVDDLRNPLFAAVGAADLALEQLNEIVDALRDRTEEARGDASARAEETRARLARFQENLPKRREQLRERMSAEQLQKTYQGLAERGEAVLERVRTRIRKAAPAKAPAKKATQKKASGK